MTSINNEKITRKRILREDNFNETPATPKQASITTNRIIDSIQLG